MRSHIEYGIRVSLAAVLGLGSLASTGHGQGLEKDQVTPTIGTTTQRFGFGMAAQEHLLVVGAPYEDTKFSNAGAAYVYRFDTAIEEWVLEQQLFPSDPEASANFGFAVAVDVDVLVVGAPFEDNTKGVDAGSAYVFRYNASTHTWSEEQKLIASVGSTLDHFGAALAISGNSLVVGAPESDTTAGAEAGSAYAFRYQGGFVKWVEEARLIDPDGTKGDAAGFTVDVQGNVAIVSSYKSDDNLKKDSGTVGIWEFNAGAWSQTAEVAQGTPIDDSFFGSSVALDGDVLAIGASAEDASSTITDSGGAYVFRKVSGLWTQEVHFVAPGPSKSGSFGNSIDVDGNLMVVGSYLDDSSGKTDSGSNWTYRKGKKGWALDQQLGASDAAASDQLGEHVALTESHIFSSADLKNTPLGTDVGVIYVYPAAEMNTEITPSAPAPGAPVTLSAFYGTPGGIVMLTIERIDVTPVFLPLLTFVFSADRTLTFTAPAPNPAFGISVGMRSYKVSVTGPVVYSELEYVDI